MIRIIIALLVTMGIAHAKQPKPLFADDTPIKITITAPLKELTRKAERSTDPYPAVLTLDSTAPETHAIMLSARGKSRRDNNVCRFPPLRVRFDEKPDDLSFFDGQKSLKLVTHCKASEKFQQYYLTEYASYKLLNILTPISLKVRLAEIDYVEAETGKLVISRFGFFIEDADDAAKRNDLKEADLADITVSQINPDAAGRYAVFQYMIGNLDWSMHQPATGNDCCHNTKLFGATKDAAEDIIPVPYDFDYSGLVDAPYAIPPDNVSVRSVRNRRYRGFCRHNAEALNAARDAMEQSDALHAVFSGIPAMSERTQAKALKFLDEFFEDIADEESVSKNLFRNCRS